MTMISFAQEPVTTPISQLSQALDKNVPERMEKKNVPGMAIAIIDGGTVIYKKGIGLANVDKQVRVGPQTGFNIGSISKMFTAWGTLKLVEEKRIGLDDPVEKYLSRWKLPDSEFNKEKVTIRSLLSHTGGISVHGYPGFHPDQKLPTLEASLDGANGDVRDDEPVKIVIEPQTKFEYSGGGYTLLQLLIEEVTGKSFATYIEQNIFKPLKMKHTSFVIDKKILKTSATPYDQDGREIYLERFTAQAAAGLHTTLDDLILFAHASLKGNKILDEKTLKLMRTPVSLSKGNYGLGYIIYSFGPITVKGHTGTNTGWESAFLLDFEHQNGMIMMSNGSNGKSVLQQTMRQWVQWKSKQLKTKP